MLDPNKPHEFIPKFDSPTWCAVCGLSNAGYANRKYHTVQAEVPGETKIWTRELTDAEQRAVNSAWPDYHGGKRHPFSTSTGMEGGCHHCGFTEDSPLHEMPWEPPRLANSAPLSVVPPLTDTSFAAREKRLRALPAVNRPAVSNSTGGEPEKEIAMNINFKLSVKDYASIIHIINALHAIDGVRVLDIEEEPQTEPETPEVVRSWATSEAGMRELLRQAVVERRPVRLDYTTHNNVFHSRREVVPFNFEDDFLMANDPMRDNATRSFKLSTMSRVEL